MVSLDIRLPVLPAVTGRVPLSVLIDFGAGQSLLFSEANAADIGDYAGPYVRQRCLRQIKGPWLVDFRPDVGGLRDEVVIEYGALVDFSGKAPQPANGALAMHAFIPPTPQLTKATGGASTVPRTVYVALSYVKAGGESWHCYAGSIALKAGESLVVPSPPAAPGVTGYNVYAAVGTAVTLQNAVALPIGTGWSEPSTGLMTTGRAPPTSSPTIAYTVTIAGGNLTAPVTIPVPQHFYGTRWRWQSASRSLVRSYDDLVAMKAILPLDRTLTFNAPIPPTRAWTGPMGSGGLQTGMAAPGDRADIGPLTEYQAAWLLTGNAGCETTWRAQAEATGSMAFWARDVATGNFIDLAVHPYVAYGDAFHGSQKIPQVPGLPANTPYFNLAAGHMPAAAFVPWLLTDDPYYLEGAQATALYEITETNYHRINNKLPCMVGVSEPRTFSWGLRCIFQMAALAPVDVPSWLQPRSYWQACLPDSRAYADKYLKATASPCTTVFGLIPFTGSFETFMQDYFTIVLSWVKTTGLFPEWDAVLDYAARPRMAISDHTGESGWDARLTVPYLIPVIDGRLGAAATGLPNLLFAVTASANTPTSWAELWQCHIKYEAAHVAGWTDPSTWPVDKLATCQSGYYFPEARGALAALALAGVPGAKARHDWLLARMPATYGGTNTFKWAISA